MKIAVGAPSNAIHQGRSPRFARDVFEGAGHQQRRIEFDAMLSQGGEVATLPLDADIHVVIRHGEAADAAVAECDEMADHRLGGVEAVEKNRRTAEIRTGLPDHDDRRAQLGDRR
ncbi:MAG: hypothetical protein QM739_05265 [Propionivibrio sp.]